MTYKITEITEKITKLYPIFYKDCNPQYGVSDKTIDEVCDDLLDSACDVLEADLLERPPLYVYDMSNYPSTGKIKAEEARYSMEAYCICESLDRYTTIASINDFQSYDCSKETEKIFEKYIDFLHDQLLINDDIYEEISGKKDEETKLKIKQLRMQANDLNKLADELEASIS